MSFHVHRLPVAIRPAETSELALLRHLHVSYLWCIGMNGSSLDAVDAYVRAMPGIDADLIASGQYFLAEADGVAVAAGGWSAAPDRIRDGCDDRRPSRGVAFIRAAFAVELGVAGRGLERRMIEHAEAAAAEAGHGIAEAFAPQGCIDIYEALGYREVRVVRLDTGRGAPAVARVMRKALSPVLAAVA